LLIDRVPYKIWEKDGSRDCCSEGSEDEHESVGLAYKTLYNIVRRTGDGPVKRLAGGLLDLAPPPQHSNAMHNRILEISNIWSDDEDEEVVVNKNWDSETKEKWGVERFALGPV